MDQQPVKQTTGRMCGFRVSGKWLADFARTRFDEGAWDRAVTLLTDSLVGLSTDQAIAILNGEADLIGDSGTSKGIRLKKLKSTGKLAQARRERMEYMYGNMFRIQDEVWEPYAIVSGWCKDDYEWAIRYEGPYKLHDSTDAVDDSRKRISVLRSMFYADDPQRDVLIRIPPRVRNDMMIADILCKRVTSTPPFWYNINKSDPVCFVEQLVNCRELPFRGASVDHDDQYDCLPEVVPSDIITEPMNESNKSSPTQLVAELIEGSLEYLSNDPVVDYAELRKMELIFERGIDTLFQNVTNDQWDQVDTIRKLFASTGERILGDQVRSQADQHGGYLDLPLFITKDGKRVPYKQPTLRVPKNPFVHWCLRHFNFEDHGHFTPAWNCVAVSGYKMVNDDPFHTDWMLGAGVSLDETYNHQEDSYGSVVRNSAYHIRNNIVKLYTGHQFTTLAKGNQTYIIGNVVFPEPNERVAPGSIAIVPHAGPEYQNAMETANMESPEGSRGCIICDVGGKLAHLVIVGREFKCTVLMLPGASKMYRKGDCVAIDIAQGTIVNHRP